MRVLVTETSPGASEALTDDLVAAGHEVVACHTPGAPTFPCSGIANGPCPIADGVDIAVTVRRHPRSGPAPAEDGVLCALRARVPVVVTGQTLFQPFSGFDVVDIPGGDEDLVGTIERVARDRRPQHEAVAARFLSASLAASGVTESGAVHITRSRDGLAVELSVPRVLDQQSRSRVAVRVVAALREFDHHAPRIDVSFREPVADGAPITAPTTVG